MVSCILLSAGESRRFGSPKALAELNAETVIEHIQNTIITSKLRELIIVLGAEKEKIEPFILKNKKIKVAINKNFKDGQTSSFKEGIKSISASAKGIMLLPVDLPLIKKGTLDSLIDFFLEKEPLILIPTYQEKHVHPPIYNINLKDEFLSLENSKPLYEIQHKYKERIVDFPTNDRGVILSFNTPEEFRELKKINQKNLRPF